jgi:hypothetical protein
MRTVNIDCPYIICIFVVFTYNIWTLNTTGLCDKAQMLRLFSSPAIKIRTALQRAFLTRKEEKPEQAAHHRQSGEYRNFPSFWIDRTVNSCTRFAGWGHFEAESGRYGPEIPPTRETPRAQDAHEVSPAADAASSSPISLVTRLSRLCTLLAPKITSSPAATVSSNEHVAF